MSTTVENRLKKEDFITIMNSRVRVPEEDGYYKLKVTSVVPYDGKYIVNLNGMTDYHITKAKELAKENKIDEAANQNLSASMRQIDYTPSKGEYVKAYISKITTKSGVEGFFVTSLTELKTNTTHKVSFSLEDFEVAVESKEEVAALKTA